MSNWNPNSTKHKAQHCGYKGKPTKQSVNALLSLYSACAVVKQTPNPVSKKEIGKQLKFDF
jgi:hypothetical protein